MLNFFIFNYTLKIRNNHCSRLEFDHNDKVSKFKAVSSLIRARYSLEKIKVEINKCEVRCANCHRRKTAKEFKWFKSKNALVT